MESSVWHCLKDTCDLAATTNRHWFHGQEITWLIWTAGRESSPVSGKAVCRIILWVEDEELGSKCLSKNHHCANDKNIFSVLGWAPARPLAYVQSNGNADVLLTKFPFQGLTNPTGLKDAVSNNASVTHWDKLFVKLNHLQYVALDVFVSVWFPYESLPPTHLNCSLFPLLQTGALTLNFCFRGLPTLPSVVLLLSNQLSLTL